MSSQRLRTCLVVAVATAGLAACGNDQPTEQLGYPDGVAPAEGITLLEGLGLYVLAPLAILLTIFALVWLPGVVRSSRYRPGRGWTAAPLWFGGPPDPVAAVEQAEVGDVVRGGASGEW